MVCSLGNEGSPVCNDNSDFVFGINVAHASTKCALAAEKAAYKTFAGDKEFGCSKFATQLLTEKSSATSKEMFEFKAKCIDPKIWVSYQVTVESLEKKCKILDISLISRSKSTQK